MTFKQTLIGLISLLPAILFAQGIRGKVLDERNEALPFATIYLQNTTKGTTSNASGDFFLPLDPGKHTVLIKYIGYQVEERVVEIKGEEYITVKLTPEQVELEEVVITSGGKDPAYAIIRKAIDRRKENDIPYENYRFRTYSKTVMKTAAKKDSTSKGPGLLGTISGADEEDLEEQPEEIAYLEENVTQITVQKPDKRKEEIISTKVSGQAGGFSFIGNLLSRLFDFSPYKNIIPFQAIAPRGLVSPIAASAMLFYDYKLLGTIRQGEHKAYKIQVIPKRQTDPVFSGLIYILDETYGVQSLDLMVTKANTINFFDTLRVTQDFVPLNDSVWVPFNLAFRPILNFGIMGMKLHLDLLSEQVASDYEVELDLGKKYFNNAVITFADSSTKRDSTYWAKTRPVPLREEEARDYVVKDSLAKVEESPEYLDSLTKARNKFKVSDLLWGGYSYYNYRTKVRFEMGSLLSSVGFNPMEGWRIGLNASLRKRLKEDRSLGIEGGIRYGFSNQKLSWKLGATASFAANGKDKLRIFCGDYPREFSSFPQISPFLDMIYTLFLKQNNLRLYQSRHVGISYSRPIFYGANLNAGASWEDRRALTNETEYSFASKGKNYQSNLLFPAHQALVLQAGLRIHIAEKYIKTPEGRVSLGSKWPEINLNWQAGLPGLLGSSVNYQQVSAGLSDSHKLGLLGTFSWKASAGTFLKSDSVAFADRAHFKSNQTVIRLDGLSQFSLMQYYAYSTKSSWLEGHAEQAFRGFIFNKIPLIKKLGLHEYAGVHFLYTREFGSYLEASFGLEKRIIKRSVPLRFDFHYRFLGQFGNRWGITFTWPLSGRGITIGG
ncbi:MAG: carboxypeptidase-like regulatory domain-containing protein [Bacteroidia bacterium]|nr:carboxypeptidase-like regulatory domain-containing protein [Bacteroidia bacterium]